MISLDFPMILDIKQDPYQALSAWLTDASWSVWLTYPFSEWHWFSLACCSFWISHSFRLSMLVLRLWSSSSTLTRSFLCLLIPLVDISSQVTAASNTALPNRHNLDTSYEYDRNNKIRQIETQKYWHCRNARWNQQKSSKLKQKRIGTVYGWGVQNAKILKAFNSIRTVLVFVQKIYEACDVDRWSFLEIYFHMIQF